MISAFGLEHRFNDRLVLDDLTLVIERGQFIALLGPNGSGKSTLLRALSGLLVPNIGQIRLGNTLITGLSAAARARHVAYVPADLHVEFPLEAREVVALGRICHGGHLDEHARAFDILRRAIDDCKVTAFQERDVQRLSGGERQLVSLARALAQEPSVLFLDEALSRMDLHHQAAVGRMLKARAAQGLAVVLVAHDLNLATEWADRAILLRAGKIVSDGAIRDVVTEGAIRALYPDGSLRVSASPYTGAPKVFFE